MIVIDDRIGSAELLPYFRPYGITAELGRLESADLAWVGNGVDGDVSIGVERKRITDLVQSIRERRLSGFQLPNLLESYDYVYLVVEGIYRAGDKGVLEYLNGHGWNSIIGSGGILYREVSSFLDSIELRAISRAGEPVRVKRTATIHETAVEMASLYENWQKRWDKHGAHVDIYAPVPVNQTRKAGLRVKMTPVIKVAAQMPGVHKLAFEIDKYFKTPLEMSVATERKWCQIDGVGKRMAKEIRGWWGHRDSI